MNHREFKTAEEFKQYVISEATKYLFSSEAKAPEATINENVSDETPSITPDDINRLAEEIKKINKTIDLRNPLISESEESIVESIMKKSIRERSVDVDGINKKKHLDFQNESEKNKWNRLLNYNTLKSDDDERKK